MPIFQRDNGSPMVFDIVFLEDDDIKILTHLIEENGGQVHTRYRKGTIKFIKKLSEIEKVLPNEKFYDIEWIAVSIEQGEFPDPALHRISAPQPDDQDSWDHFLRCTPGVSDTNGNNPPEIPSSPKNSPSSGRKRFSGNLAAGDGACASSTAINVEEIVVPYSDDDEIECKVENISLHKSGTKETNNMKKESESRKRKRRGRGSAFTASENRFIIAYLVKKNRINDTKSGLNVWNDMINDGICPNRPPNSLYCHFKFRLLPKIEHYAEPLSLTKSQLQRFKTIREEF